MIKILQSLWRQKLITLAIILIITGLNFVLTFTGREEFVGGLIGVSFIFIGLINLFLKVVLVIIKKRKKHR